MVGVLESFDKTKPIISLSWKGQSVICVFFLIGLVTVFQEYRVIEEDHLNMRMASARIGSSVNTSNVTPDTKVLTQLREFVRFARTEATPGMSDEELEWMRRVSHRYTYPPALFRYALALGLNERYREAEKIMGVLKRLHGEELYLEAKASLEVLADEKYPQLNNIILN